jgi:hypothetical protein
MNETISGLEARLKTSEEARKDLEGRWKEKADDEGAVIKVMPRNNRLYALRVANPQSADRPAMGGRPLGVTTDTKMTTNSHSFNKTFTIFSNLLSPFLHLEAFVATSAGNSMPPPKK